jgi:drug/metabolite transporter (DMT)-like permease
MKRMRWIAYDGLALAAAGCWAVSGMTSMEPSQYLGAFAFARWRAAIISVLLWGIAWITGGWHTLSVEALQGLGMGGLIGVFIGDTALYASVACLGPRRAGVLFSMNAVFSVWLGVFVFHETITTQSLGIALASIGVMIAILWGRRKQATHQWEADQGSIRVGIALGLVSAVCQSMGTVICKPIMQHGVDPLSANAIRTTVSALAHSVVWVMGFRAAKVHHPMTWLMMYKTTSNAVLGMGVGMTCLMMALRYGDISIVSVLSAVTPVLILPLLWWYTKQAPAVGAWIGAILTILGTGLIVLR